MLFEDTSLTLPCRNLQKGWSPPPPEWYLKLNIDAAMFFDFQHTRAGVILRDVKGAASIREDDALIQ